MEECILFIEIPEYEIILTFFRVRGQLFSLFVEKYLPTIVTYSNDWCCPSFSVKMSPEVYQFINYHTYIRISIV